jgi:hypothetical protein
VKLNGNNKKMDTGRDQSEAQRLLQPDEQGDLHTEAQGAGEKVESDGQSQKVRCMSQLTLTCFPELEDLLSQQDGQGSGPSPSASAILSASDILQDDGPASSTFPTSGNWTEESSVESSCSQGDFLASLSVLPGSEEARKMTVRSGRKCSELLRKQDRITSLVKTLLESSTWNSTRCYLTWKISATPVRHRLLLVLWPWTPLIEGNGCGLWLTPSATSVAGRSPESMEKREKWRRETGHASVPPGNLAEQVNMSGERPQRDMRFWPTPNTMDHLPARPDTEKWNNQRDGRRNRVALSNLREAVRDPNYNKFLPTPRASDYKGSGPRGSRSQKHMEDRAYLCATVATEQSGMLNPEWIEWLQGYPVGFTGSGPLEIPSPPRWHCPFSRQSGNK